MPTNPLRVVVTDGFHITQPLELKCQRQVTYIKIGCAINNDVLVGGAIFMLMFYAMGSSAGVWALQLFSLLPIFALLFLYYIKRKEFIQVQPA